MKVVGIKELKARLSEYVRLAKAGDTVLVTEGDVSLRQACEAPFFWPARAGTRGGRGPADRVVGGRTACSAPGSLDSC
jgi:hypothetical protein